jgi:hypothetical protein
MPRYRGGCHCGRVRFEVEAPDPIEAQSCNCSMCAPLAYLHLIVPRQRFRLLQGEEALVGYAFGTRTARHLFCGTCGIKSFYVPRSHPEGYSVNVRCLEGIELDRVRITPFDGANWEEHAHELPPLPEADS